MKSTFLFTELHNSRRFLFPWRKGWTFRLAGDQTHDLSSTWALRNRDQPTVFIRTDIFEYIELRKIWEMNKMNSPVAVRASHSKRLQNLRLSLG